jgi:5'(3')-deoxyribonucleotidase
MHTKFDPSKNTIYVDMDGVLADFDKYVDKKYPDLRGKSKAEFWKTLQGDPALYSKFEPMTYAKELWDLAKSTGANVEILTAIPRKSTMPFAEADKKEWIKKHIDPSVKVKIGPYSRDKWKHAKPGDILIDDRADNIRDWIDKGDGVGILHDPSDFAATKHRLEAIMK